MRTPKIIVCAILAVLATVSCQKERIDTPTFSHDVVVEQSELVPTPEGFENWPRTIFVFDKASCVKMLEAENEAAMSKKLDVGSGYQVVVLAYDSKDNLLISPNQAGEALYRYKVTVADDSKVLPRLWYAADMYDSESDSLKLSFSPITSTLNIEFESVPSDLDSISFDLPASMDVWYPGAQKSEVSKMGAQPTHIVLTAEQMKEKLSMGVFAMLNYNAQDPAIRRCQIPVCYYYKEWTKPGVIPYADRIGEAQVCDVKVVDSDPEEENYDNDFNISCSLYNMVGGDSTVVEQPLSLWPIKKDFEVALDTTYFKMNAGRSFAFQFGSIDNSWHDWHTSFDWGDRGPEIRQYAEYGFDFYRIPIDEGWCFFSDGTIKPGFVTELQKMVDQSIAAGVRVILDLHWLAITNTFPNSQQELGYRACWRQLHELFKDYDPEWLAYELLNEANGLDGYWNTFIANSVAYIRSFGGNEVRRKIVCSCAPGQNISGMDTLELPEDANLIASFHDYSPTFLGFYATGWSSEIGYDTYTGPCHYPGRQVTDAELEYMKAYEPDNYSCANMYWAYEEWNYSVLYSHFYPAYEAKKRLNVPVWVGEYGAYPGIKEYHHVVYCRSAEKPSKPSGGSESEAPEGWYNKVPKQPDSLTVWMSEKIFLSSGGSRRDTDWIEPVEWNGETVNYVTYWQTTLDDRRLYYRDVCTVFRNFGFSHSYWFSLSKEWEHDELDMDIINYVVGKDVPEEQ